MKCSYPPLFELLIRKYKLIQKRLRALKEESKLVEEKGNEDKQKLEMKINQHTLNILIKRNRITKALLLFCNNSIIYFIII